jgi:threonine dehydrogenase-like Zn-dependent dehydrogenase
MKAITVEPMKAGSTRLEDVPEPDIRDGSLLVEAIAVGVCGTDVEIAEDKSGWAPPGKTRLVLGHESLARVLDPRPASGLKKDDLVVGSVNANKRHGYKAGESITGRQLILPILYGRVIPAEAIRANQNIYQIRVL